MNRCLHILLILVLILGCVSYISSPWQALAEDGTRAATVVVAASDSSPQSRAEADYICDGVDDQVEINTAIGELPTIGGKVLLMEGTFWRTEPIVINRSNFMIEGMGPATIIKSATEESLEKDIFTGDGSGHSGVWIKNLMVHGNWQEWGHSGAGDAFDITNLTFSRFTDLEIQQAPGNAFFSEFTRGSQRHGNVLENISEGHSGRGAFILQSLSNLHMRHIRIESGGGYGLYLKSVNYLCTLQDIMTHCHPGEHRGAQVRIQSCWGLDIRQLYIFHSSGPGLELTGSTYDNHIEAHIRWWGDANWESDMGTGPGVSIDGYNNVLDLQMQNGFENSDGIIFRDWEDRTSNNVINLDLDAKGKGLVFTTEHPEYFHGNIIQGTIRNVETPVESLPPDVFVELWNQDTNELLSFGNTSTGSAKHILLQMAVLLIVLLGAAPAVLIVRRWRRHSL
ncbi:MAG: hypothetical protein SVY53_09980 [Chloroflexota bacterium]|nr:hypothetical protein [Chloroflexota bacterium]